MQICGREKSVFAHFFLLKGTVLNAHLFSNWPVAGVDCGSCCFFSLNSQVDFSFFPMQFAFLETYFIKKKKRINVKKRRVESKGHCC